MELPGKIGRTTVKSKRALLTNTPHKTICAIEYQLLNEITKGLLLYEIHLSIMRIKMTKEAYSVLTGHLRYKSEQAHIAHGLVDLNS